MAETEEPKTLTPEDVEKIVQGRVAAAKREATQAAEQALKDKLGGKTIEELIAAAQAKDAADEATKTQTQKDADAAAKDRAEAARIKAEAAAERHITRVHSALVTAGASEDVAAITAVPGLTVESTPEEVKAAVDALKVKAPQLFTPIPTGGAGDPGQGPKPTPKPGEFGAGGLAEFEKRFPKTS